MRAIPLGSVRRGESAPMLKMESRSTAELVREAKAGSSVAFDYLFERFRQTAMAIARHWVWDEADAEDICQDAFFRAYLNLRQLQDEAAFAGWFKVLVMRVAINHARRNRPLSGGELALEELLASREGSGEVHALRAELQGEVQAGLSRLKELDRETIVAYHFTGLSVEQMAAAFDAPVGTIKRRLHVARLRLAEQMQASTSV